MNSRCRFKISFPDVQDRLLPLVQTFESKIFRRGFFRGCNFDFGGISALRHQVFIDIADTQVRNVLVIGRDDKIAATFARKLRARHIDSRRQTGRVQGAVPKRPMRPHRLLRFINGAARGARDFRDAPLAQCVHAIAHQCDIRVSPAGSRVQVEASDTRANPARRRRGIKGLNHFEHFGYFFRRQTGRSRTFPQPSP